MDNTSRAKPRLKAMRAESRIRPTTPRSTMLSERLLISASSPAMLLAKALDQLREMVDGMQLQAPARVLLAAAERRDQGIGEAQFLRLLEALLDLADGADFAPQ